MVIKRYNRTVKKQVGGVRWPWSKNNPVTATQVRNNSKSVRSVRSVGSNGSLGPPSIQKVVERNEELPTEEYNTVSSSGYLGPPSRENATNNIVAESPTQLYTTNTELSQLPVEKQPNRLVKLLKSLNPFKSETVIHHPHLANYNLQRPETERTFSHYGTTGLSPEGLTTKIANEINKNSGKINNTLFTKKIKSNTVPTGRLSRFFKSVKRTFTTDKCKKTNLLVGQSNIDSAYNCAGFDKIIIIDYPALHASITSIDNAQAFNAREQLIYQFIERINNITGVKCILLSYNENTRTDPVGICNIKNAKRVNHTSTSTSTSTSVNKLYGLDVNCIIMLVTAKFKNINADDNFFLKKVEKILPDDFCINANANDGRKSQIFTFVDILNIGALNNDNLPGYITQKNNKPTNSITNIITNSITVHSLVYQQNIIPNIILENVKSNSPETKESISVYNIKISIGQMNISITDNYVENVKSLLINMFNRTTDSTIAGERGYGTEL